MQTHSQHSPAQCWAPFPPTNRPARVRPAPPHWPPPPRHLRCLEVPSVQGGGQMLADLCQLGPGASWTGTLPQWVILQVLFQLRLPEKQLCHVIYKDKARSSMAARNGLCQDPQGRQDHHTHALWHQQALLEPHNLRWSPRRYHPTLTSVHLETTSQEYYLNRRQLKHSVIPLSHIH